MSAVKDPARRSYAGLSGAQRAARRRDAIVEAAFALVAQDGWRALRIENVCRRAGLNKRYFYESFADLDAVVGAVMRRLADDAIAVTLAAPDPGAPPDVVVRDTITALVRHVTEDPRRARVLFGAVAPAEAAAEHRSAAIHQVIVAAAARGASLHGIDDARLLDLSAAMLVGGTGQAVLDWLDGRLGDSYDAFVDDLVALWQVIVEGTRRRALQRAA